MRPIFRATIILSSSSIATILVGLVSAKFLAILLGPAGFGFIGLLQGLIGLAGLIFGLGIAAGLVREVANAIANEDSVRIASLRRASWVLLMALGGLGMVLLTVFRVSISRWMLGRADQTGTVVLMGLALFFSLAYNIQIGTLNGYHRVKTLARVGVINSIVTGCLMILLVWIWGAKGIVPAVIVTAGVGWAVTYSFSRKEIGPISVRPPRHEVLKAARVLLHFGSTYTAGMLVGTGVQMALPILVLHTLGADGVGYYRAASSVAINYLGFMLAAIAQDYYPRVSAALDQPQTLCRLINEQHRMVMLLAVPVILGALGLVPYLVPIVFSPKFIPAVGLLEWQLIGDLFKFSSWTMSYVILVRSKRLVYFGTELTAGIVSLMASWMGIRWFGLTGLGIAFLVTYIVYYLVVLAIVRRDILFTWTADNKWMMGAALAAVGVIRVLPYTAWANLRTGVSFSMAVIAAAISLRLLWKEMLQAKAVATGYAIAGKAEL